ncbi:MAG TPA: MAPEG family protein [Pseudomonadales bacterium]|nr:MAPEG family protein [Pseudomonadales bacterium]
MAWVHIVAMVALLEYFFFGIKVGQARGTYGVKAPATTGNEMFERFNRVHQNTLEQLIMFIPGLYAFATLVSPLWAAVAGVVFVVGRAMYFNLYIGNPDKRGPGVLASMLANAVLIIGTLIAAIMSLF